MKQYPVKTVDIPNGETIAYRQAGTAGPVVVLIHGNNSSSVHWQTTMEQLEGDYQVYAPDLRGFGDSSYERPFDSIRELSADVEQFVDALGIEAFSVVGWSAGGPVALEIAADWPERVKSVTLLCTGALTGFPIPTESGVISKEAIAAVENLRMFEEAKRGGNHPFLRMVCDMSLYHVKQPEPAEYEAYLAAMCQHRSQTDINYSLASYNMTHGTNINGLDNGTGRVDLLRCPVTVIHAELDKLIPLVWSEAVVETFGDRAQLVILQGLSHSPVTDDLPQVVEVLRQSFGS
ncbi:MAG: alpha/beta hydrolase [Oscillospiraceae bacterium]|nr:alpha/beta hydrolase [Oscillospiraceae bacterium]